MCHTGPVTETVPHQAAAITFFTRSRLTFGAATTPASARNAPVYASEEHWNEIRR